MKVKELYSQVAQLGFLESLERDANNRFYYAANRAMLQISALRPTIKSITIKHNPFANMIEASEEKEVNGELIFEAEKAKAYYFEFEGTGDATIYRNNNGTWEQCGEQIVLTFGAETFKKGFVKDDTQFVNTAVRIKFTNGDYVLRVKNVALYGSVYSDNVDMIPDNKPYTRYDIGTLVTDFQTLYTPLINEDGDFLRIGEGYDVEDNRVILLPREKSGEYRVQYIHKPKAISLSSDPKNNDEDIDLSDDLASLMPILIASYIWIDEEPEKAQYYLALYREGAMAIERRSRNLTPGAISTNGWA